MLLTDFCKKVPTEYEKLQNEIGYFDAPAKQVQPVKVAAQVAKKLVFNNMPQPVEKLVARLNADKARVETMTDAFGTEITRKGIAELEAFLTANNVAF